MKNKNPKLVFPLTSWLSFPWHVKRFMTKNPAVSILGGLLLLLFGAFATGGLAVFPIIILAYFFYFLNSPEPLTLSEVKTIENCVEDCPEIEEYIAEWLTDGPLDQRHYRFILSDWVKRMANAEREEARKEPDKVNFMLRSMGNGRIGKLTDEKAALKQEKTLSNNTAKAKNVKSKQPRL